MKVKIQIAIALEALEKNLTKHIDELAEANEVWTEKTKAALDNLQAAVDRDGLKASSEDIFNLFRNKPQDSRAEYSRYMGLMQQALKSGMGDVEIDEGEYDCIFNDNFQWRRQSFISNSSYKK